MDRQELERVRGMRDLEAVIAIEGLIEELRWSIVDRAAARDPEAYDGHRMEAAWKRLFAAAGAEAWRVMCVTGWVPGYEDLDVLEDPAVVEEKRKEVQEALAGLAAGEVLAVHALVRSFAEGRMMEDEARDAFEFVG